MPKYNGVPILHLATPPTQPPASNSSSSQCFISLAQGILLFNLAKLALGLAILLFNTILLVKLFKAQLRPPRSSFSVRLQFVLGLSTMDSLIGLELCSNSVSWFASAYNYMNAVIVINYFVFKFGLYTSLLIYTLFACIQGYLIFAIRPSARLKKLSMVSVLLLVVFCSLWASMGTYIKYGFRKSHGIQSEYDFTNTSTRSTVTDRPSVKWRYYQFKLTEAILYIILVSTVIVNYLIILFKLYFHNRTFMSDGDYRKNKHSSTSNGKKFSLASSKLSIVSSIANTMPTKRLAIFGSITLVFLLTFVPYVVFNIVTVIGLNQNGSRVLHLCLTGLLLPARCLFNPVFQLWSLPSSFIKPVLRPRSWSASNAVWGGTNTIRVPGQVQTAESKF